VSALRYRPRARIGTTSPGSGNKTRLVEVQGWSGIPHGQPLFESIVVFENYPLERSLAEQVRELGIDEVIFSERTHYPLTLVGVPGEQLTLRLAYDRHRFTDEAIEGLLRHLETLLHDILIRPEARLSELSLLTRLPQLNLGFADFSPTWFCNALIF